MCDRASLLGSPSSLSPLEAGDLRPDGGCDSAHGERLRALERKAESLQKDGKGQQMEKSCDLEAALKDVHDPRRPARGLP